ncbi:MAG: hypothetical protein U5R49_19950 [Deltaproteobacteria bacterium]|nr:hypothetical protein [Deltaproteobacteria bacterium]
MRFITGLVFAVFVAGCAAQPLDLHIPEDHPANPEAVFAPPSRSASDYQYTLPAEPVSPDEAGNSASSREEHLTAPSHKAAGDMPHEKPSKTHGGSHAH